VASLAFTWLYKIAAQGPGLGRLDLTGAAGTADLRVAVPADLLVERMLADVVVIGSGAAGGVLADRLARGGRRVLVLERGTLLDADKVPAATLVREALRDTRRGTGLEVLQAQCVGGSTLIGDGIAAPLPPPVMDEWRSLGGPAGDLPIVIEADTVVLAAGAIQSSAILRRSGLGGGAVGSRLHCYSAERR
jgi:choline dehydrogenase-like flavoprotein